ncbi:MAG: hypothetical protein JWQ29_1080 [Phenylobacterium sp.]|nr:hypothetical protein [Phenylobacterium sp.]
MGRAYDPARAMRERLKILEARETARTEARAVGEGVAETVALSQARGAAIEREQPVGRSGRETPYRRRSGLEWLSARGKLTERQRLAGERYGACYRRAAEAPALGSTLQVSPGRSQAGGPSLDLLLKLAEGRRRAQAELAGARASLFGQGDLVTACDRICGQEMTPREAAGGDRDAARMEAVLGVALDLLAAAGR